MKNNNLTNYINNNIAVVSRATKNLAVNAQGFLANINLIA